MSTDDQSVVSKMLGVMVNVVGMMSLGAWLKVSGRLTSDTSKGLSTFVGVLALPALFFKALAGENLYEADPLVVAALVVGKSAMLTLSILGGWWAKMKAVDAPGLRELRCGMFAMLTTNGDELGLGIPVVTALFPTMVPMLFVLASIQKFFFLPMEMVLLGVGKALKAADGADGPPPSPLSILGKVMAHKLKEPLVLAIFGGLLYNLLGPAIGSEGGFSVLGYRPGLMGGAALPVYVDSLCSMLGSAFSPLIFVLTGAASVGTFSALASYYVLVMPVVLVTFKSMVLPSILYTTAKSLGASNAAQDFSFVVGLMPAAGSSMVICMDAGINERQALVMMATLSLGKLVAFPLLLLATPMLTMDAAGVHELLEQVNGAVQAISLVFCTWFVASSLLMRPHAHLALITLGAIECALLLASLVLGGACGHGGVCVRGLPWAAATAIDVLYWVAEVALLCLASLHIMHLRRKLAEEGDAYGRTSLHDFSVAEKLFGEDDEENMDEAEPERLSAREAASSSGKAARIRLRFVAHLITSMGMGRKGDGIDDPSFERLEEDSGVPDEQGTGDGLGDGGQAKDPHGLAAACPPPPELRSHASIRHAMAMLGVSTLAGLTLAFVTTGGLFVWIEGLSPTGGGDAVSIASPLELVVNALLYIMFGLANFYSFLQLLKAGMSRFSASYNLFFQRLKLLLVINTVQLFLSAVLMLASQRKAVGALAVTVL